MKLYLAHIGDVVPEHLLLLSPQRAAQAQRYRMPADRKRCIAGGLLLRRFVGDTPVVADACGKPRAQNGVCFNLSHSGDWVLLAVSDREVGCDIEAVRQTDALRMGRVVYTDQEMALLRRSPDRLQTFFSLWTKKEALLKCMGSGFSRPAKTVDVCDSCFCEDGHVYRIQTKSFADYVLSVCVRDGESCTETQRVRLQPNDVCFGERK